MKKNTNLRTLKNEPRPNKQWKNQAHKEKMVDDVSWNVCKKVGKWEKMGKEELSFEDWQKQGLKKEQPKKKLRLSKNKYYWRNIASNVSYCCSEILLNHFCFNQYPHICNFCVFFNVHSSNLSIPCWFWKFSWKRFWLLLYIMHKTKQLSFLGVLFQSG